jgi:hypothetical protein
MSWQSELSLGILGLLAAIAAAGTYRWLQHRRTSRIESWVEAHLLVRYGKLPESLHIQCTNDRLWPILVSYDHPLSGDHHRLQFLCQETESTFRLVSETTDRRVSHS